MKNLVALAALFVAHLSVPGHAAENPFATATRKNHCSLALRKRTEAALPIFYCFRDEPGAARVNQCTLRQIHFTEGVQPYFGLPGNTQVEDIFRTDLSCAAGGVSTLLDLPVSEIENTISWLAHSPVLGGEVEVIAEAAELRQLDWAAQFKAAAAQPAPSPPPPDVHADHDGKQVKFISVPIFFGTDRQYHAGADPDMTFREEQSDGKLVLGSAEVRIQKLRRRSLPDLDIFKFESNVDTSREVSLKSVKRLSYGDFYDEMRGRVGRSPFKDLFVYVHGYNTTFAQGAKNAAQLAYDLNFQGAPVLYSWPAGDFFYKYAFAESTVEKTWPRFAWFLRDIFAKSGAKNIFLVAHSMGNRAAVKALTEMARQHWLPPRQHFRQVVLAAADVATVDFAPLEHSVRSLTDGLTIYGSDGDRALSISNHIHQAPRLGEYIPRQSLFSETDSIDATRVAHGLLGHGYIIQNERVVSDLRGLFAGIPARNRPHIAAGTPSALTFWNLWP